MFGDKNNDKVIIEEWSWAEFYATTDDNKALNIFDKIYNKSFNEAFPLKSLSRKWAKDKNWITTGLKSSIHHEDNLFKNIS